MVLLAAALVIGFLVGTWRAGPTIRTGTAHVNSEGGGSIEVGDWTYGIPADVEWTDVSGSRHDRGHPDCLPPLGIIENVRFASVDVNVEGLGWRPVIWVDCRSVHGD
jgi:hypothetical protein